MRWMVCMFLSALFSFAAHSSFAAPASTKTVIYKQNDQEFEGFVVYPKTLKGKAPGVLLVANWLGNSDETRFQAQRIADLGYIVFAADIYGKGIRPKGPEEAGALAGKYKGDRKLFRERLNLGLERLKAFPEVDSKRLLAAGYCFGGTGVLELARSGADLKGVVSFHGGLDSPTPADGQHIKAKVLVLHGADDPLIKAEDRKAFEDEMRQGGVDWQLYSFGGAVHSFTDKSAGSDKSKGVAYNAEADARSFAAFQNFAKEVL